VIKQKRGVGMIDVAIIGAGTAGLTAAVYALSAGMTVKVFEKLMYGGQLANNIEIDNFPAILKISGSDLAMQLYDWAAQHGVEIVFEEIISVNLNEKNYKEIVTAEHNYIAQSVIIATGVERRKLRVKGENELIGKGVSYCATCDGAFFKNKEVAVVGGGNSALEEAIYLANICSKVYIVHRRDEFRGEKALADEVAKNKKIETVMNSIVRSINGEQAVESIKIKSTITGRTSTLEVSAVFISIGMEPNNHVFNGIKTDEDGFIIASEDCKTNINGVFVAGDTRTKPVRQLVTAAADGAVAGKFAADYVIGLGE
jgi:thioredoxin reductase (NADPH)